jgi:fatty-acid desaturase
MKEKWLRLTASSSEGVAIVQLLSTLGLIFSVFAYTGSAFWLLSLFIYFCTGCLGITVTFHRFLSHRSFSMPTALEKVFSFFGSMGGTGSALGWVALHRAHHQHSDQEQDPHSPANGALALFLSRYRFQLNKWVVRDMIADPFHRFMHMYYHLILLGWSVIWLCLDFKLFLFVVAVPMAIQIWVSILSNCFNHLLGYRNFETNEKSTNNIFIALISWGEGWHNNHHRYPRRWNFQVKWWELDISSWVIRLISSRKTTQQEA